MRCPTCQTENKPGGKFCKKCGSRLELLCPFCGQPYETDSLFCCECGRNLKASQERAPIDYSCPQSYTPRFLAEKILTSRTGMEGERKVVTVLFADVANYTSISEKLDPEEVHEIVKECFQFLMDEIHRYEGTITQFTGDGVMALFGAPVANEDHAQRTCFAALAIQKALAAYEERVRKARGLDFKMRIGINSGSVYVGSIGDDLRMDYTAIGDTINLGSRLQSMARPGGILVSDQTYKLCKEYFEFKSLGKLPVKGKEEPQESFELIQTGTVKTRIGASVAKGLTPFAGRKNSMAGLMGAYEEVKAGSGQVVGVTGEPGVGKSRLLLEFRKRLPKEGFSYVEGRCLQYGTSIGYLPILDLLRGYFGFKAGTSEPILRAKITKRLLRFGKESEEIITPIQDLLSIQVTDEAYLKLKPSQRKEKVFESLRWLLAKESQEKPMIIAIEDLHWVDKTTEEFLRYLIGWVAKAKIMLILLYRHEYVPPWANQSNYTRIALTQLTNQSSAELVRSILEEGEVVPELLDLILDKAGGNPLFMEELTESLLENGSIIKENNRYVLSRKASEMKVPETIQGIIAARIDRLEESLKRIMQVASVIGREFAFSILQGIMEMKEELKSSLLNLQGLEFIYEKRLFPELEYIFKHALTQEVAYNSVLLKKRKEIHKKIGLAIEQLYPDRLEDFYEMMAYHYSRSDDLDKARQYLKLSGDKSTRNHSLWEAYRFYKETLAVLRQMPQTEANRREQIEVILLLAVPMRILGYPENSIRFLEEGERFCRELGDRRSMATLYTFLGVFYSAKGDAALGKKYLEDSLAEAEIIQDVEIMSRVSYGLCFSYMLEGAHRKLINLTSKNIRLLERTHNENEFFGAPMNLYTYMLAYRGIGKAAVGEFRQGEQACGQAMAFAKKINHLFSLGISKYLYGGLYIYKGDGEKGVRYMQSAIQDLEKSQGFIFLPTAWSFLGHSYFFLGEFEKALGFVEKGLKMQLATGLPFGLAMHYLFLSRGLYELENLAEAKANAEQALKLAKTNNQKFLEGMSLVQLGRTIGKLEEGQFLAAEDCITRGLKILDELEMKPDHSFGVLFLGGLYADAGQKEKALENLRKAETRFQQMGMDYWLVRTKKLLGSLRA